MPKEWVTVIIIGSHLGPRLLPLVQHTAGTRDWGGDDTVDECLAASSQEGLPLHCPRVSLALNSTVATYGSETHYAKYNDV